MLVTLTRRQPQIMALGMGGRATPLAQLLAALGWGIIDVPFYVAPVHPARVVDNLPLLRQSPMLRRGAILAARAGIATAAGLPVNLLRKLTSEVLLRGVDVRPVPEFDDWATRIWAESRDKYGFAARRDAPMLNRFYPADFPQLTRLRVTKRGREIGWVCVTVPRTESRRASRELGQLRVGLLADGMGSPNDAATLLAAGFRFLVAAGADLLVTNQMHESWRRPLRYMGFLQRQTNFLFGYSKSMGARLAGEIAKGDLFLNRGDCDGPPR
jgi:hypothetical protein